MNQGTNKRTQYNIFSKVGDKVDKDELMGPKMPFGDVGRDIESR